MVAIANIQPGETGWEPQAGNGQIAVEMRLAGIEPDVSEISSQLREILELKNFNLIAWDCFDVTDKQYDVIVANPPFSNNLDIKCTQHCYSRLTENGRLVTIIGEGAFHREGKLEASFREWLTEIGAEVETLPAGTFTDSQLMVTTNANARLVTIRK